MHLNKEQGKLIRIQKIDIRQLHPLIYKFLLHKRSGFHWRHSFLWRMLQSRVFSTLLVSRTQKNVKIQPSLLLSTHTSTNKKHKQTQNTAITYEMEQHLHFSTCKSYRLGKNAVVSLLRTAAMYTLCSPSLQLENRILKRVARR